MSRIEKTMKTLSPEAMPTRVRVSAGAAVVLGLIEAKLDALPTTVYLMTDKHGKCNANCQFCPQARESHAETGLLSRVSWPAFPTGAVIDGIEKTFSEGKTRRVCIQALNYRGVFAQLSSLVSSIRGRANVPISVSCQPTGKSDIVQLFEAGAERIGIPLDAATEDVFAVVKGRLAGGPYRWRRQFQLLHDATRIFGRERVSTHLIVGLGETEEQAVRTIQRCVNMSVLPGLFAFTPIRGTALESRPPPELKKYRRVQLARYLIQQRIARSSDMSFDEEGNVCDFGVERSMLADIVGRGDAFLTSGCPDCNRPFYNEKPSGPIYNYPRNLTENEISEIKKQLKLI